MRTVTCKGWWWTKEKGRREGGLEMVGGDTSSRRSQVAHTGTQGVCTMYYNCSKMWGKTDLYSM